MVKRVSDYKDFEATIKSNNLVYIFGSGISCALTGENISWLNWIKAGTEYIAASDKDRINDILSRGDTASLVEAVGEVLKYTKACGRYHEWMQTSFERLTIKDTKLAESISRLSLLNDIIATTNYDLLLEEIIGMAPATYENPDIVFSMIDNRQSDHVIHLHGAYSSIHGINNIIADKEQYNKIYNDEGAQFIQNLLGTRTLIFVGCGQTMEDVNISRFIQFASKHLHLDIPYYFICKEDLIPTDMPAHIVPIVYGDEYDDMPVFIDEMISTRLNHRIKNSKIIGRNAYESTKTFHTGIESYHYTNRNLPFVGRQHEMRLLRAFLDEPDSCLWWAITGQAGSGKSRLALEFLYALGTDWFGFFLKDTAQLDDIDNFVPFNNTTIIVDYIQSRESLISRMILRLSDKFDKTGYKLRIVLLERDAYAESGSWYRSLFDSISRNEGQSLKRLAYRLPDSKLPGKSTSPFIDLHDMDEQGVLKMIGEICRLKGLPEDEYRDKNLRSLYAKKMEKLRFRPLFVQLFVESWIDNNGQLPEYYGVETLLEQLLDKEQGRWSELLGQNISLVSSLIRLLIRACAGSRIELSNIPKEYEDDWKAISDYFADKTLPGKQRQESLYTFLREVSQNFDISQMMLEPMYPDIVKEYMVAYYLDESKVDSFTLELWANAPYQFSVFLFKALQDFPQLKLYQEIYKIKPHDHKEFLPYLSSRIGLIIKTDDVDIQKLFWDSVRADTHEKLLICVLAWYQFGIRYMYGYQPVKAYECALKIVELCNQYKEDEGVVSICCSYLVEYANSFSSNHFYEQAENITNEIERMAKIHTESAELLKYHMVSLNAMMMADVLEGNFMGAERSLDRMKKIYNNKFRKVPDVAEYYSFSCYVLTAQYFEDWNRNGIEKTIRRLLTVKEQSGNNTDVIGYYTKALVYRLHINLVDKQKKYEKQIETDYIEIEEAAKNHPENMKVCEGHAHALLGMFGRYVKNDDLITAEQSLNTIESYQLRFPESDELAQLYMRAYYAFTVDMKGQTVRKTRMQYFEALNNRFPNLSGNREIYLDLLRHSEGYSESGRHDDIFFGGGEEDFLREIPNGMPKTQKPVVKLKKVGRNETCPCGSGKKYKRCCGKS